MFKENKQFLFIKSFLWTKPVLYKTRVKQEAFKFVNKTKMSRNGIHDVFVL